MNTNADIDGKVIRIYRWITGIQQKELAEKLGINTDKLSKIELNKKNLPDSLKEKVKDVLNISEWNLKKILREYPLIIYKKVHAGVFDSFPRYFFTGEEGLEAFGNITRYLAQTNGISADDIPFIFNCRLFEEEDWSYLKIHFEKIFKKSPFAVVDNAWPGQFKPMEFRILPHSKRYKINQLELSKKKLEEIINNFNDEEILEKFDSKFIEAHIKLKFYQKYFLGSPFIVLDTIKPNKYKPWQLKAQPYGLWEGEIGKLNYREFFIWFSDERLKTDWHNALGRKRLSMELRAEANKYCTLHRLFGSISNFKEYMLKYRIPIPTLDINRDIGTIISELMQDYRRYKTPEIKKLILDLGMLHFGCLNRHRIARGDFHLISIQKKLEETLENYNYTSKIDYIKQCKMNPELKYTSDKNLNLMSDFNEINLDLLVLYFSNENRDLIFLAIKLNRFILSRRLYSKAIKGAVALGSYDRLIEDLDQNIEYCMSNRSYESLNKMINSNNFK